MTISARATVIRNAHPRLRFSRHAVASAVAVLDAHATEFLGGCLPGELSIIFLTDVALAKIHADFLDDPAATDVITFGGDPASGLAGEICISADTAARYVGLPLAGRPGAARRSLDRLGTLSLSNGQAPALQAKLSAELTLYVVHGWLHLAGYDDLAPAKKRRMRAAEKRAMALLHAAKTVPEFRLK